MWILTASYQTSNSLETVLDIRSKLWKDSLLLDPGISNVSANTVDDHNVGSQGVFVSCSALYVVDLKKFRRIAAGDRLRGQYQTLSQDPNSLSNLDQVSKIFME